MNCVSCGNPQIDALLNSLPGELSPGMFGDLLLEAPKVYSDQIGLQPETSRSFWLGLFEKQPFPVDQTEYSEIRITSTTGLDFFDNNSVFRKLHDPDGCVPGCVWDPRSFRAGNEIYSSSMVVADFEQEIPCYDNMYKKFNFIRFFTQVPIMLNQYMENIMASYTRNELLARAKKIVLTEQTYRSHACDSREWPNLSSLLDAQGRLPSWDLTPSVLLDFIQNKLILHPEIRGLADTGGYPIYGLVIEPYQWQQKIRQDKNFSDIIIRNSAISSKYFTRFGLTETFNDQLVLIPATPSDIPRADVLPDGSIVYHHAMINVPAGQSGFKKIGNPAYANAKFGLAMLVNADLGHLWDEQPIPNPKLPGGVNLGPNFGQSTMTNAKWTFLNGYDYKCNPLGKGGKWISQYKTGFHPGRGLDGLYLILYPLTKYEHMKQQLLVTCGVDEVSCTDGFQEDCEVCPGFVSCCNISELRAVVKFDGDTGYEEDDIMPLVSKGSVVVNATVDEVVGPENGIYTYLVTLASAISCNCIDGVQCQTTSACAYEIISQSLCKLNEATPKIGLKANCPITLEAGTVMTATLADGSTLDLTYVSDDVSKGVNYSFFSTNTAGVTAICLADGVVSLSSQDTEACPEVELVTPACSEAAIASIALNDTAYTRGEALTLTVTFNEPVTAATPGAGVLTWTGVAGNQALTLVADAILGNTITYTGTVPNEAGSLSVGAQTLTGTVLDANGAAASLVITSGMAVGPIVVA